MRRLRALSASEWVLLAGVLALALPTMISVAQVSWSTEQGGHGPLVLATGLWLLARERDKVFAVARPGRGWLVVALLVPLLVLYFLSRVTGIIEIEGFVMYGALLATIYALVGGQAMRCVWFPLAYLLLVFPPPDTVVALVTQPIKIAISSAAVKLLYAFGYPIASSGVSIQIAQYDLLIAAACAGLNSIISLAAICLFYIYIRHNADIRYFALLLLAILPVAVFANFVRVIFLILLTYHFGDAVGQGFMHHFAGLVMFTIALLTIFLIDAIASPLRRRLGGDSPREGF